jgi:gag-polyprotein putative aspartyl protease
MAHRFDPTQSLIIIQAQVEGPSGTAILRLALDTGASKSLVNTGMLIALGYDPALAGGGRVQVTTGSGIEYLSQVRLLSLTALGVKRSDFALLCHTLPPSTGVDGLLGLDFLEERNLTIDFRSGQIDIK